MHLDESPRHKILSLKGENKKWSRRVIEKIDSSLGEILLERRPLGRSLEERVFMELHDMGEPPACLNCAKPVPFRGLAPSKGYASYCSLRCGSSFTYEKGRQTKKQNGTDYSFGTDNYKNALRNKYGVENIGQVKEIKERIRNTFDNRYGTDSALTLPHVREKSLSNESKAKRRESMLRKYDTASNFGRAEIKAKAANTIMRRYGTQNVMRSQIKLKVWATRFGPWVEKRVRELSDRVILVSDISEIKNKNSKVGWKCVICNSVFISDLDDGKIPRCYRCWPNQKIGSKLEQYVLKQILNDLDNVKINDRTTLRPYEIDFLIDQIGIEINGLYWHSATVIGDTLKDLEKQIAAEQAGICLLQFFHDEIVDFTKAVKSEIYKSLGRSKFISFDEVVKINNSEALNFISQNSFLRPPSDAEHFAAVLGDNIVAVVSVKEGTAVQFTEALFTVTDFERIFHAIGVERLIVQRRLLYKRFLDRFNIEEFTSPAKSYTDFCRRGINKNTSKSYIYDCGSVILRLGDNNG